MTILLALVVWIVSVAEAAAVIRTHGTLESCIVTIGDFCPIESVGYSLTATFILALIIGTIGVAISAAKAGQDKSRLADVRPQAIATARAAIRSSDYEKAGTLLAPYIAIGDREATVLRREITDRAERKLAAFAAARDGDYDNAMQLLAELVQKGDVESLYLLGMILTRVTNRPELKIRGVEWLAVAASRGSEAAKDELAVHTPSLDLVEVSELETFVESWTRKFTAGEFGN